MTRSHPPDPSAAPAAPPGRPGVSAWAVFKPLARRSAPRSWRNARLPLLMLAGTLVLTLLATSLVFWALHATDRVRFDNAVHSAEDRVRGRIDTYVALLYGARGLFAASRDVDASEFHTF